MIKKEKWCHTVLQCTFNLKGEKLFLHINWNWCTWLVILSFQNYWPEAGSWILAKYNGLHWCWHQWVIWWTECHSGCFCRYIPGQTQHTYAWFESRYSQHWLSTLHRISNILHWRGNITLHHTITYKESSQFHIKHLDVEICISLLTIVIGTTNFEFWTFLKYQSNCFLILFNDGCRDCSTRGRCCQ